MASTGIWFGENMPDMFSSVPWTSSLLSQWTRAFGDLQTASEKHCKGPDPPEGSSEEQIG